MVAPLHNAQVAATVAAFPSRKEQLEQFLQHSQEAHDLLGSTPVLAFALAHCDHFRRHTPQGALKHASYLVNRKQRDILTWLGFPGTEAAVRLFRKIRPEAATIQSLRLLREALNADAELQGLLAHQRTINTGVLATVSRGRLLPRIAPRLLLEIAEHPDELSASPTADLLVDTIYMLETVLHLPVVPLFHSMAGVRRLHDEAAQQCIAAAERAEREVEERALRRTERPLAEEVLQQENSVSHFPPPPFPGTEHIVALTSNKDLVSEAKQQNNCLASYCRRVREEPIYLYRVLKPQRATLCIRRGKNGYWRIQEMKLYNNAPTHPATCHAVRQWLQLCQMQKAKQRAHATRESPPLTWESLPLFRERTAR